MVRRAILVCVIGVGVSFAGARCASRTAPVAQPGMVECESISVLDRGVPSRAVGRETVWEYEGFARNANRPDEPLGRMLVPESSMVLTSSQRVTRMQMTTAGGIGAVTLVTAGRDTPVGLTLGTHLVSRLVLGADGTVVHAEPAAGEEGALAIDVRDARTITVRAASAGGMVLAARDTAGTTLTAAGVDGQ